MGWIVFGLFVVAVYILALGLCKAASDGDTRLGLK